MKFKKTKQRWEKPFSEKIAKRVSKIPTMELEVWVEQSIYEVGRCMSMYNKSHRDVTFLDEALIGAEALHAVVYELKKRTAPLE